MRKAKQRVAFIFILSFFASCAKDYRCNCDYNGESLLYTFSETSKSKAETKCETYEGDDGLLECKLGE